jgi:UMF1 family MFS transporter
MRQERPGHSVLAPGVRAREVWAWAMFDFANSGYTTVVITAIFNAYFVAVVAGNAPWATLAWTATLGVSYLLNALTAPALGAFADRYACKKALLGATTLGCIIFTAALAFVDPGEMVLAIICLIAANFFFGSGENLIAAFLPELAHEDDLGKVSGWGWGLGYVGGMVTLGICLAYVTAAQARGESAESFVPGTLLITAAIFAVGSLPTFLLLKERSRPQPGQLGQGVFAESIARLRVTLTHLRRYRDLAWFLVCVLFYQSGVQTVITLAAVYAEQAMRFSTAQTITLILVVNVAAAIGAAAFGHVQDRLGHKRALALILVGWIVMVVLASYSQDLLFQSGRSTCGVLWALGPQCQTIVHSWARNLRDTGRAEPRRASRGILGNRNLLFGRTCDTRRRERRARATGGGCGLTAGQANRRLPGKNDAQSRYLK